MSLIRYNTLANDYLPATFGSLIDRFFHDSLAARGGSQFAFVPKVDILEDEKGFDVHVAVPGMNKEDFKIDLNDRILTVSGERKFSKEKNEQHHYSIETQYGTFSRSFTLPKNVDGSKIDAQYVNGILQIRLPKDEKKSLKSVIKVS